MHIQILGNNQTNLGRPPETDKMSSVRSRVLPSLLLFMLISLGSDGADLGRQWCIADEQATDELLQQALDWACGVGGADCRMIQPNKPCYLPNTLKDHASFAFNSYWQKFKNKGGSCYFSAAAMVTDLNPSHGSCQFESVP
ncbi:glucan endo-1,3-beta-glucosidase 4 isoform X2 [Ananas comosus]|uniref:Glucan endo-1,3-beta-glucosidase 4 isoform X2 n=2 Tax=Ananas comosus TaxID=4615 RepID=A0A6P5F1R9_ANACO|nr:glucan endo-1,3-beta-glucosidase 4 isoform X2 [Ananas comosus]